MHEVWTFCWGNKQEIIQTTRRSVTRTLGLWNDYAPRYVPTGEERLWNPMVENGVNTIVGRSADWSWWVSKFVKTMGAHFFVYRGESLTCRLINGYFHHLLLFYRQMTLQWLLGLRYVNRSSLYQQTIWSLFSSPVLST